MNRYICSTYIMYSIHLTVNRIMYTDYSIINRYRPITKVYNIIYSQEMKCLHVFEHIIGSIGPISRSSEPVAWQRLCHRFKIFLVLMLSKQNVSLPEKQRKLLF